MDVSNVLPGDHEALHNAAVWLRLHLNIDTKHTIFSKFEEYFNCRIDVADRKDNWATPNKFVFESSAELTAFVLRWS